MFVCFDLICLVCLYLWLLVVFPLWCLVVEFCFFWGLILLTLCVNLGCVAGCLCLLRFVWFLITWFGFDCVVVFVFDLS